MRAKTIEKTSNRMAEGCISGLGLPGARTADFLEFPFADFEAAEVVFELNRVNPVTIERTHEFIAAALS